VAEQADDVGVPQLLEDGGLALEAGGRVGGGVPSPGAITLTATTCPVLV